jgi:hypothetical protein
MGTASSKEADEQRCENIPIPIFFVFPLFATTRMNRNSCQHWFVTTEVTGSYSGSSTLAAREPALGARGAWWAFNCQKARSTRAAAFFRKLMRKLHCFLLSAL